MDKYIGEKEGDEEHVNPLKIQIMNAKELDQTMTKLGCGDVNIDKFLKGGIQTGQITEIYGEGGTGKTHMCMQLMLHSLLPVKQVGGLDGGSVYISTQKTLSHRRLDELKYYYIDRYNLKEEYIEKNIHIFHINSIPEFENIIQERIRELLIDNKIKLLIIDNIGSFNEYFSNGTDKFNSLARALFLRQQTNYIKKLIWEYKMVALIINNVVANIGSLIEDETKPSLGLCWTNCINQRICFYRERDHLDLDLDLPLEEEKREVVECKRYMKVIFSSYLPPSVIQFKIDYTGIRAFM